MACGVQITRKSPNSRETISSCTMRRYLPGDGGVVLLLRRCNWRRLASWWRETWRRSEKVDRDSNARGSTEREKERGGRRRERERLSTIDDEKERGSRRSTTRERERRAIDEVSEKEREARSRVKKLREGRKNYFNFG